MDGVHAHGSVHESNYFLPPAVNTKVETFFLAMRAEAGVSYELGVTCCYHY